MRNHAAQLAIIKHVTRQESRSSAGNCQADEPTGITQLSWPVEGTVYSGTVTGIKEFGAFVEYAPGKEGLVHISKLANHRVEKVEDVLKLGDTVKVKYIGLDKKGRMDFSIKDAQ